MVNRICNPLLSNSFFLFGARATGKTTLLNTLFKGKNILLFDFLKPEVEEKYATQPGLFQAEILAKTKELDWVVLDEVQRLPKLLNSVHSLIESHKIKFALTGSSASKLKRGKANLLAGRAFLNHLFPLTYREYDDLFNLDSALTWGTLPRLLELSTNEEKSEYLRSYVATFIREEIKSEQLVRNLDPFRRFLEVAAQSNAKIINYSNIHRDVGVDVKTIQNYYTILEDTMIGFFLEAHSTSVRKSVAQKPKFYFFDLGVQRTLAKQLVSAPTPSTSYYGELFESFFILEVFRLNHYYRKDFSLSYLKTKDDVEIDLIVRRPGKPLALIEIKSSREVRPDHLKRFTQISSEFKGAEKFCAHTGDSTAKMNDILVTNWRKVLESLFE